jgi:ArsR family transcriptional regulator, cadmium/lead-responsive transcriptional repressor
MTMANPALALEYKSKLFRGLADPARLSILEALRTGPLTVGEIVVETGLSQPNTSNHLSCLRDCGLVTRRQRGRYAIYDLADDRVRDILTQADLVLRAAARGFYECTRYATDPGAEDASRD